MLEDLKDYLKKLLGHKPKQEKGFTRTYLGVDYNNLVRQN